jgi:UDP-2,3-diacylglucosamine pyrophosphatase LpxH
MVTMPYFDTVILSDVHLGSEMSRAGSALRMLKGISFSRLILLGDIFCDLNFSRLKKEHWQFLGYIRKLSNPKREIEVIWVEGNHDHGLAQVMSHLVGIDVYEEYAWTYGGVRHLAIHGHQFDRFLVNNRAISNFFTAVHFQLQKLAFGKKRIVGFLERFDTMWLRLSSKVAAGALAHGMLRKAQRVFCGHTHEAMQMRREDIEYFNTGCWTQASATYITIGEEGVKIHEYEERADDSDTGEERSEAVAPFVDIAGEAGLLRAIAYEGIYS